MNTKKSRLKNPSIILTKLIYSETFALVFRHGKISHNDLCHPTKLDLYSSALTERMSKIAVNINLTNSGKKGYKYYNFIVKEQDFSRAKRDVFYSINYSGIVEFLFTHYLKTDNKEFILHYNTPILKRLLVDYLQQELNEDDIETLDYLFDYFIKTIGSYDSNFKPRFIPFKKSYMEKIKTEENQNGIITINDIERKKLYDHIKNIIGKNDGTTDTFISLCKQYNYNQLFNL